MIVLGYLPYEIANTAVYISTNGSAAERSENLSESTIAFYMYRYSRELLLIVLRCEGFWLIFVQYYNSTTINSTYELR